MVSTYNLANLAAYSVIQARDILDLANFEAAAICHSPLFLNFGFFRQLDCTYHHYMVAFGSNLIQLWWRT